MTALGAELKKKKVGSGCNVSIPPTLVKAELPALLGDVRGPVDSNTGQNR